MRDRRADRLAEQSVRKVQRDAQAHAGREVSGEFGRRRTVLDGIDREVRGLLPELTQAGYPEMVSLRLKSRTWLGFSRTRVRGAWRVGTFAFEGSNWAPEGEEPLLLLSDGTLVTFGGHNFRRFEIDDEIWWRRRAPEALLEGLRSLRSRLAKDPKDD